jgi:glutamate synthase domain-containing protein 1/glutamate synthase domain-containing protein 3
MTQQELITKIICSRKSDFTKGAPVAVDKSEAEGGCGVIGIACSEKIAARHLLQALIQMRNRGNGKGGGLAAVGLVPSELGVSQEVLDRDYLVNIAYLESDCRAEVENKYIGPVFETDYIRHAPRMPDFRAISGLEIQPPEVYQYFVRPKASVVDDFKRKNGFDSLTSHPLSSIEDELVYQNSYRLNQEFYSSAGRIRSFVLSHGKNMIVYKMVGYGDDVVRYYQLEDLHANIWIGHHRYPTKGRVWHPGGAHPFVGLQEALVHNGDFANYASICEYLSQRNIRPLFLTDTEVSVLVFDLLHRTYGYPLEYVIEALAPTTERDFSLLPEEKQHVYRMLQQVHMHGSPDGPWFFLIAQSKQPENVFRLIGITDTSMLRPQVFALQEGAVSIGFAASEKQAIDAALESLASDDSRFWTHADQYWNARGGSHTDGGAFVFTVKPNGSKATLLCNDKFGRPIMAPTEKNPYPAELKVAAGHRARNNVDLASFTASGLFTEISMKISNWTYEDVLSFLDELEVTIRSGQRVRDAIQTLTLLIDRRYPTGTLRRSSLLSLFDQKLSLFFELLHQHPSSGYVFPDGKEQGNAPINQDHVAVLNARLFSPEGERSLAMEIVRLYQRGFRRFVVLHAQGHRFIANGLGASSHGVAIDVYGSSGDYLASGIDGAEVIVHGNAQDQLAQVMKDGKLVVYGDVGQTFMYAAKGGQAFVLGNAAGRPMINAVGKPRVVINGTCLDYLAESFMAGDPLNGGGFVILNGIALDDNGKITDLDTPYPGSNLFSLASGGAIYIRDPRKNVSAEQLNGGDFVEFTDADWTLIRPYLEENERLFGIPLARLLETGGKAATPAGVYRKIRPLKIQALLAGHDTGD